MSARLELRVPYPPSANRYWRSAPGLGMVPSREASAYKTQVAALLRGVQPLAGPVCVEAQVNRPRATGDLDNALKVLLDALRGLAFLDDDQVQEIHAYRADDAPNAGVVLIVSGERHATRAEALAHQTKRAAANQKRKATLARNRSKKAFRGRATPSFRMGGLR